MNIVQLIAKELNFSEKQVSHVLKLFEQKATIPFIARYRKEFTGGLKEEEIYAIEKQKKYFEELDKRKQFILKTLEEQNILTEKLQMKIVNTYDAITLEDIYLPYKKKKKTKAEAARLKGLEPLAKIIMSQKTDDLCYESSRFISDEVPDKETALEGARHIIAEWMNENLKLRNYIRRVFERTAKITTKVVKSKENNEDIQKYSDYFEWNESLRNIPSHRLLAILRAEKESVVRVKLSVDTDLIFAKMEHLFIKNHNKETAEQIKMAIKDAYKRLLEPSISTEILNKYKEKADQTAIRVFSENLRQLLMSPPLGEKRVLAIDPGFRTGCKLVCLNEQGTFLHYETLFIHPPQSKVAESEKALKYLIKKYDIEAFAIGNGTASRETENFVKNIDFGKKIPIYVVSEAGASIYSASKIAREEFPDLDITIRGAISIGRRLQDPLAELVKIDPKSIGVGQYQYDVNQTMLKEELNKVVESVVNRVGVNLNTAGKYLLKYVSGIGEKLAQQIVNHRTINGKFNSREDLKKIQGLGKRAFEQAAGFLRIKNGINPLDNSSVHPESYSVVKKMAKSLQVELNELIGNNNLLKQIDLKKFVTEKTGLPTLKDIINELKKPGLDIRKTIQEFSFHPDLKTIDDLKIDAVYPGIINNITNFGCFVDLGIKENGLVHISNMSENFIRDPNEIVHLHQKIQVKVVSLDLKRKRIGLSLIL